MVLASISNTEPTEEAPVGVIKPAIKKALEISKKNFESNSASLLSIKITIL